jgi:hypothetical protein
MSQYLSDDELALEEAIEREYLPLAYLDYGQAQQWMDEHGEDDRPEGERK